MEPSASLGQLAFPTSVAKSIECTATCRISSSKTMPYLSAFSLYRCVRLSRSCVWSLGFCCDGLCSDMCASAVRVPFKVVHTLYDFSSWTNVLKPSQSRAGSFRFGAMISFQAGLRVHLHDMLNSTHDARRHSCSSDDPGTRV